MLGIEDYIKFLNESDKNVIKALEVLENGESFPKAPGSQSDEEKSLPEDDKNSAKA